MVNKNKNISNEFNQVTEQIAARASQLGLTVMVVAACMNMAEMVEHGLHQANGRMQPAYAVADEHSHGDQAGHGQGHGDQTSRGAREEVGHSHASYGASRRSPSVSGPL